MSKSLIYVLTAIAVLVYIIAYPSAARLITRLLMTLDMPDITDYVFSGCTTIVCTGIIIAANFKDND